MTNENDAAVAFERLRDPPTPFDEAMELLQLWHMYDENVSIGDIAREIAAATRPTTMGRTPSALQFLREKIVLLRKARIDRRVRDIGQMDLDDAEELLGLQRLSVFGRRSEP